jgi:hypothetical protein
LHALRVTQQIQKRVRNRVRYAATRPLFAEVRLEVPPLHLKAVVRARHSERERVQHAPATRRRELVHHSNKEGARRELQAASRITGTGRSGARAAGPQCNIFNNRRSRASVACRIRETRQTSNDTTRHDTTRHHAARTFARASSLNFCTASMVV